MKRASEHGKEAEVWCASRFQSRRPSNSEAQFYI